MGCTNPSNKTNITLATNYLSEKSFVLKGQSKVFIENILKQIFQRMKGSSMQEPRMLFRASDFGGKADKFYQNCQYQNTLILIKTDLDSIIGGYTTKKWQANKMYYYQVDEKHQSFLFKYSNQNKQQNENTKLKICSIRTDVKPMAICCHQNNGPIFGQGHDLFISDNCMKINSWSNIGKTYQCQYAYKSIKANKFLTNKKQFLIQEYQVWLIQCQNQLNKE